MSFLLKIATRKYYLDDRAKKSCEDNNPITDVASCEKACKELNLPRRKNTNLREGKICYKDFQGYCKQDGSNRAEASFVCTKGNFKVKIYNPTFSFKIFYSYWPSYYLYYITQQFRSKPILLATCKKR